MSQLSSTSLIMQVQKQVCNLLNEHYQLSTLHILPENSKDIEYEITRALKVQGIVGVVMTPTLKFIGTDSGTWNAFQCDDLTIQVVENPIVNRASRNAKTSQDWAYLISDVLTSPLYGHFGMFNLVRIENGEDGGLLVSKVIVKTMCENQVSALPVPPDYRETVPFATRDWVKDNFISSVMSSDYATKVWVNEQGFLKEHQSLSDYYTKSECDLNFLSNNALNGYATETWTSANFLSSSVMSRIEALEQQLLNVNQNLENAINGTY